MAYVTGCTSLGIRTPTINQSERATITYVTGCTYAVLTNQSTGIAYVTACTYAFRPIRARYSNEGAPPQYVCAPLARPLRPPRPPCAPLKIRLDRPLYYYCRVQEILPMKDTEYKVVDVKGTSKKFKANIKVDFKNEEVVDSFLRNYGYKNNETLRILKTTKSEN